ncbi:MAG TPA: MFS transporter [Ktedonobacteraceae bacterium]
MNEVPRTNRVITLVVTCLGAFMILLDTSIVTLALPAIQAAFHTSLADLQWTVDAYTLPFAVLMLTAGTLGDRFGRKSVFVIGLVLFMLGSALCGFAPGLGWLLFGRVVQGVGAAALSTTSLSILVVAFPEPRARAQAIGLFSGVSGIALAVGPLVGGLLVQLGNWPAIFFVNLPLGLIALVCTWVGLAESRNPRAQHFDLPGQVLVIIGLSCLVMALIEGSSAGWTSPLILGLFAGALIFLVAFVLVEQRVREPLLPLQLFGTPVFSAGNIIALIFGFATLGPIFFLAQYFQQVQGNTVLEAGVRTFPISMGAFLTAPLAGVIAGRIGSRLPTVVGGLLCGSAVLLLMTLQPDSSYASVWWILGLMGIGFGFMLSPVTTAIFSVTPADRAGLGSSVLNTSRQVGGTLGIAVLGAYVVQQFASNIPTQLIQRGVPASLSTAIANRVAAAGAAASQALPAGHLPLPTAVLHQAISAAFVDALHGSFLISGIAVFAATLLAAFTFQGNRAGKQQVPVASEVAPEGQIPVAVNAAKGDE